MSQQITKSRGNHTYPNVQERSCIKNTGKEVGIHDILVRHQINLYFFLLTPVGLGYFYARDFPLTGTPPAIL